VVVVTWGMGFGWSFFLVLGADLGVGWAEWPTGGVLRLGLGGC